RKNTLRQCYCRRDAGGIFIDIERVIKMWNPQALQVELPIQSEIWPEIGLEKFVVLDFKHIKCEGAAVFFDCMDRSLELSKHRLAKERASNVIDLAINDVGPHFWIISLP